MPNHYTTIAICAPGYDFDCDAFNEKHAATDLCEAVKPMPESVKGIPSIHYPDGTTEKERRGESTDWYEWAQANWGTTWGTYQMKAFALGGDWCPIAIKFQSAWRAPSVLPEIAEWLKRIGGFDNVVFIGFDPSDESTRMLESTQ